MTTDPYEQKLKKAAARAAAHKRGEECQIFIINWVVKQGLPQNVFKTPEKIKQSNDSLKDVQKKLRAPFFGGRQAKWPELEEITAHFNQRWSDESAWRQRLDRCGIPYADRSDAPDDLWERIEPVEPMADLKSWIDSKPGVSAMETRGRVLLSLVLYELHRMEMVEKISELTKLNPNLDSAKKTGPTLNQEAATDPAEPPSSGARQKKKPGAQPKTEKYQDMHDHFSKGGRLTKRHLIKWKYNSKKSCITAYQSWCNRNEIEPAILAK